MLIFCIHLHFLTAKHIIIHLIIDCIVNKKNRLLLQKNMVRMGVMLVKMVVLLQTSPGKCHFVAQKFLVFHMLCGFSLVLSLERISLPCRFESDFFLDSTSAIVIPRLNSTKYCNHHFRNLLRIIVCFVIPNIFAVSKKVWILYKRLSAEQDTVKK